MGKHQTASKVRNLTDTFWFKLFTLPSVSSLLINVFFAAFFLLICVPYWESNDDFAMYSIASGLLGVNDHHVVFVNIFLGVLLKFLYVLVPAFPWYTAILTVMNFGSYWLISYLLIKKLNVRWGSLITCLILLLTGPSFYVVLNFTRVSAIACVAGHLGLLESVSQRKLKIGVAGAVLMLAGAFLRFNCWIMISAIAAALWLFILIPLFFKKANKSMFRTFFKEFKLRIVPILLAVITVASIGACYVANQVAYKSDPDWDYYSKWNRVRASIIDYEVPNYEDHREEYTELGLTENDVKLFKNWSFADPDLFPLDTMLAIESLKEEKQTTVLSLIQTLIDSLQLFHINIICVAGLVVFFAATLLFKTFKKPNKYKVICAFTILIVAWALIIYLCIRGRSPRRVIDGLGLGMFVFMLFVLIDKIRIKNDGKKWLSFMCLVILIATIVFNGTFYMSSATYEPKIADKQTREAQIAEIEEKMPKENLYLLPPLRSLKYADLFSVFDNSGSDIRSNSFMMGGWTTNMPATKQTLERYGYENPYEALYQGDNVFLVAKSDAIAMQLTHIKEHYIEDFDWSVYDSVISTMIVSVQPPIDDMFDVRSVNFTAVETTNEEDRQLLCRWIKGTVSGVTIEEDALYYIRLKDNFYNSHSFRVKIENGEFYVGVPREYLKSKKLTAELVCIGSENYQSEEIELVLQ